MSKQRLISDLENYESYDILEEASRQLMIQFLEEEDNNFCRSNLEGHFTGCGLVVNPERTHVLMINHIAYGKWLLPGGHCDGESIVQKVARREVMEETGLQKLKPISPSVFDVDVHPVPERKDKGEPEHYHYDLCYLFEAEMDEEAIVHQEDEVHAAKWVTLDEFLKLNNAPDFQRYAAKVRKLKPSRR